MRAKSQVVVRFATSTVIKKQALASRGLTGLEHQDVLFILSVLDGHGLFHQPIPAPKQPRKYTTRAATAAANRLRLRIMEIRTGTMSAADARERRLAEEWPRLGKDALKMQADKIRCATYQTLRGGGGSWRSENIPIVGLREN